MRRKQLPMYYRSGTGRHCCICTGRCFVCTHQVEALLCVKWRHGRHLEKYCVWQIENMTLSVDAYLLREQYCQISSRSDFKRQSPRLFWRRSPQQEQGEKNLSWPRKPQNSAMFSVIELQKTTETEQWHKFSERLAQTFITLRTKRLADTTANKYLSIIYNINQHYYCH